jgi:hypothetical protein
MTQRANDFLIWRAGTSVNWECTVQEIADETGIPPSTVSSTCRRKGWKLVHGNVNGNLSDRPSIDHIMASKHLQFSGAT